LTEYDLLVGGVNGGPPSSYTARVSEEYPINSNGSKKNIMGKAFYKSHELALASIDSVEKSIREESDSKNQDAGKWR
uniref:hypothetical protein n=1 Tax=Persicitalea sp. TaxID=3100273 RepID=UPI003593FF9F